MIEIFKDNNNKLISKRLISLGSFLLVAIMVVASLFGVTIDHTILMIVVGLTGVGSVSVGLEKKG